jgi:hypothetical protein
MHQDCTFLIIPTIHDYKDITEYIIKNYKNKVVEVGARTSMDKSMQE